MKKRKSLKPLSWENFFKVYVSLILDLSSRRSERKSCSVLKMYAAWIKKDVPSRREE